ncbi:MAG: MSMEG_1061 family FMN-dependent PPOX-type flavoprotein [Pseudomonadota bacterium]
MTEYASAAGATADPHGVDTLEALLALYGEVNPISRDKETVALTPAYRAWIEHAPFFALATIGEGGLDCSPRGDPAGDGLAVLDDRTLAIPDRRGNNRLDSLRNIVADPRVALMFLVPGAGECLRVNGRARLTADPALTSRFAMRGAEPACVIVVRTEAIYYQCARAILRAALWSGAAVPASLPSAGEMNRAAAPGFDAEGYDAILRARQNQTLY